MKNLLTIGMATYDDYDGTFFTIQSLRMYHPICETDNVEIIILDNNPDGKEGKELKTFANNNKNKIRYIEYREKQSSFNKYEIVNHAKGKYVMILDCHVLLYPYAIDHTLEYYAKHKNCKDLLQGPLVYGNLKNISTSFKDEWRGHMYGTWYTDKEKYEADEPFEIPMQGMGLCSFERANFPKISPHFIGFGGEEGYIAEKFRRNGGKNICIPQLKWMHRFGRPGGPKYRLTLEDRIWNYFIGWLDATDDENHRVIKEAKEHFKEFTSIDKIEEIFTRAKNLHMKDKSKRRQ